MSALSCGKLNRNCDAVNSSCYINQSITSNSSNNKTVTNTHSNNGTKLNDKSSNIESQEEYEDEEQFTFIESSPSIVKQDSPNSQSNLQFQQNQKLNDVQKVLKQEQELQKQLYSGSNVAPGWLRVIHNQKVIYISPSGIGLASLKQVKNYLLTRGTCKCGLPFPLRVELFFNFNTEVSTVPLKSQIDSIKFDPTCQHRKRLTTTSTSDQTDSKRQKLEVTSNRECSTYVSTASSKIINQSTTRNTVMIVNNSLTSNNVQQQQQQQQMKPQQLTFQQRPQGPHFIQHDGSGGSSVVMRVVKDDGDFTNDAKLPPWKKNSMIQQSQISLKSSPQSSGIPIYQINGQNIIAIDQNNQQFQLQPSQQIQIIEQNELSQQNWTVEDGKLSKTIIRRKPNFKEDPTGYLNQQTALLQNTITKLHSPDGSSSTTSSSSPALQETAADNFQRTQVGQRQFIQHYVKQPNQITTMGGQTVTHMPNGIVQIQQTCDIKQQQQQQLQQPKPLIIQEQIQMQQNKFVRQNPKGRPPKNPQTIAKRLVAMSQESPVSSTSTGNVRITKSNTPDISSSSHTPDGIVETIIQSPSYDASDIMKFTRSTGIQEMVRTSMTQVLAGKTITNTSTASQMKRPQPTVTMMKKPQNVMSQVKNSGNFAGQNQQIVMTSNGQQFIVMPSTSLQQQQQPAQSQNIILNNNSGMLQIQNSSVNANQRLIHSAGQSGNILIQTSNGNVLATNPLNSGNFILSNGQQMSPLILQNGQIVQNSGNIISSGPKGNILFSPGSNATKTIISNNQFGAPMLNQQTVLINGVPTNVMMQTQPTIVQDSSQFAQTSQTQLQQQQRTITMSTEKKKGRKRKIPLAADGQSIGIQHQQQQNQQQNTIHTPQQSGIIQMTPQGFQLASPNIIKIPQQGQQIIQLQNGQVIQQQQPMNILGGQQFVLPSGPIMVSPDGNSIVQLQNPTFNNLIATPQGMMIRTPVPQQQGQKTIITNNGQQFIVNQNGQLNPIGPVFNTPMGFIVQAQQNQHQQLINTQQPIIMQSPQQQSQHIQIAQPQVISQGPTQITQGSLMSQQTQYISQNDSRTGQRKIIQQKVQQQKFYPQIIKPPRTIYGAAKNTTIVQEQEIEEVEDDDEEIPAECPDEEEPDEICEEMELEDHELMFEDDKPCMIQELHHGSQQVLMGDGQCGIMNIDDIIIDDIRQMDEINDINEYLNTIDDEDDQHSQSMSSNHSQLLHIANSPPDTTTHSPRSPMNATSEKSNSSSDSTNMVQFVSSSEEGVDSSQSPSLQQINAGIYSGNIAPTFKSPMEPKIKSLPYPTNIIRSPSSSNVLSTNVLFNLIDKNQRSPLMRPDSHESASSDCQPDAERDEVIENEPTKSDFDLLKESPPVNNIKPVVMVVSEDSPPTSILNPILETIPPLVAENPEQSKQDNNCFSVGDLVWGAVRGCDAWPGKIVDGPDGEPTSSDCVWVKWFGGRQNTEMVLCGTLKSLSEGLEAHHAAQKDTRKGRKLNSQLERAIQKAMSELDKQSNSKKSTSDKKAVTNSNNKSPKSKLVKIAPAPDKSK